MGNDTVEGQKRDQFENREIATADKKSCSVETKNL